MNIPEAPIYLVGDMVIFTEDNRLYRVTSELGNDHYMIRNGKVWHDMIHADLLRVPTDKELSNG